MECGNFCFAKKLFDRSLALVRYSAGLMGMMEVPWSSQDHVEPCHQEDSDPVLTINVFMVSSP
jgi:hypothetical protein